MEKSKLSNPLWASQFCLVFFFLLIANLTSAQFTRVSGDKGLNISSPSSGGQAWGDLNNDGYEDVIVFDNTSSNVATTKMYFNDGPPNFTFTDTTSTVINGFNTNIHFGRQLLIADFNNDGLNDVLRGGGGNSRVEIFFNNGISTVAPFSYTFGDASQNPDFTIIRAMVTDGAEYNMEGVGAIDWNQDGWLDILMDNDGGSNDLFENNGNGTFTYIDTSNGTGETGFPDGHAGDGDYLTVADINNDGYVDFYGRKTAVNNYWRFDPSIGQFVNQSNPNIVSNESDKGGTMFCDFDSDGDLDLFWTAEGDNEIWRNDGKDLNGDDVWTATGIPAAPIRTETDIDGCDCGDIDNDGDLDIILGGNGTNSYVLTNQLAQTGSMTFNTVNINTNDNTEGLALVDYDNDGDLDLYIVNYNSSSGGGSNQLWENGTDDANYLYVNVHYENPDASFRDAIGANVTLLDCNQNTVGMRQVNGAMGHGTQHQKKVHFGVDPNETYTLVAYYVFENGSRKIVKRSVRPADYPDHTFTVRNTDSNESNTSCANDLDGDGIDDLAELDSDNDGVPNSEEVFCGSADWSNGGSYAHLDALTSGSSVVGSLAAINPVITITPTTGTLVNYRYQANTIANTDNGALGDGVEIDYTGAPAQVEIELDFGTLVGGKKLDIGDLDFESIDSIKVLLGTTEIPLGIDNFINLGSNVNYQGNTLLTPITMSDILFNDNAGSFQLFVFKPFERIKIYAKGTEVKLTLSAMDYCDFKDADGDNVPDFMDLDSDNDGIPDIIEGGGVDVNGDGMVDDATDTDGDGLADVVDNNDTDGPTGDNSDPTTASTSVLLDADANGTNELGDNDGDGIYNFYDLDADNDGLPDLVEVGGIDADGNGKIDNLNPDGTLINDLDEDGFADVYDPDNDLIAGTDIDGANQPLVETNASGDNFDGNTGATQDTDGDTIPNYLDVDSDNDGIVDIIEALGVDVNGDGRVPTATGWDADGNGLADQYDAGATVPGTPLAQTTADDGAGGGVANDGHTNGTENWIAGAAGITLDTDEDTFPNVLDIDSDNDGIVDIIESGGTDSDRNGLADDGSGTWVDTDGDGLHDDFIYDIITVADGVDSNATPDFLVGPGQPDRDGDGFPNWLDIDADNDGIIDNSEGQATASYIAPNSNIDTDGDGLADAYDDAIGSFAGQGITPVNTDTADLPDYLDLDTDNDGEPDWLEGHDTNNDGAVDANAITNTGAYSGTDADADGLDDGYDMEMATVDATNGATEPADFPENDALTADMDWRSANGNFGGLAWEDIDEDGIQDLGEAKLANVSVELFNASNVSQGSTQTNASGTFLFTDLVPGNYYVTFTIPGAYNLFSPMDAGSDDAVDSDVVGQTGNSQTYAITVGNPEVNAAAGFYSGVLPVTLISFDGAARGCEVKLNWSTGTEENFEYFVLERSTDGREFITLDHISSHGQSGTSFYSYQDESAQAENYYRLKMVDLDGKTTYSEQVQIQNDCLQSELEIFPNPINVMEASSLQIKVFSDQEALSLMITDRLGRVIRQLAINEGPGWHSLAIDINDLSSGMYFIMSTEGKKIPAKKFIVINER